MKEIHLILTALAALSALASAAEIQIGSRSTAEAANRYRVASPDGTIEAQLRADKRLSSSVHVDGEPVIGPSRLGLSFGEALQLGQNVRVVDASTSERNES
jgi:alpha-glucosidase